MMSRVTSTRFAVENPKQRSVPVSMIPTAVGNSFIRTSQMISFGRNLLRRIGHREKATRINRYEKRISVAVLTPRTCES